MIINSEENKSRFRKFRKWAIIQKYTLQRGYIWGQVPAIGIIFASSVKAILPGMFNTFWKFAALALASFIIIYAVGYTDRKLKFLHEENNYSTETNPILMAGLKKIDNMNINKEEVKNEGNTSI